MDDKKSTIKKVIIIILIMAFAIMIVTSTTPKKSRNNKYEDLRAEEKIIVDKFKKVGFSQEDGMRILDIVQQCNLGAFSEENLESVSKKDRILKEKKYDKAYASYVEDKKVSEYRNLYFYFKKNELVYICSSNYVIEYYSKEKGPIDDYHRTFVN